MIVCVCVCVLCIYVRVPVYGGQRTTLWSWFSPCSFNVGFKNHIQVSRLLPQTLLLSHLSGPKVSPSRPDPTAVYQDPTWDLLCHPSPVTVDRCICSILNTEQIKSQGRKLGLSTWESGQGNLCWIPPYTGRGWHPWGLFTVANPDRDKVGDFSKRMLAV